MFGQVTVSIESYVLNRSILFRFAVPNSVTVSPKAENIRVASGLNLRLCLVLRDGVDGS